MESVLVNSILASVCSDFAISGGCTAMLSPTGSESSSTSVASSGYSSEVSDAVNTTNPVVEPRKNRDILDLYFNLTNKEYWPYRPTALGNRDIRMFLSNRSVFHRCDGYLPGVSGVENCKFCGFPVPVIL